MKTTYPIWFLYSSHHRKPDSLSTSLSGNKMSYAGRIAMISHQLIYESTANDVFWILYSNMPGEKQGDCCRKRLNVRKVAAYPF